MALLEASGIGKNFGETHVLKDISLDLEQGEALAVIGSSGSGKTTLLRCLNFLERPDTGVIKVNGETMCSNPSPITPTIIPAIAVINIPITKSYFVRISSSIVFLTTQTK